MAKSLYKVDRQNIRIGDEDREVIVNVEPISTHGTIVFDSYHSYGHVTLVIESPENLATETVLKVRVLLETFQGKGALSISIGEESPTHQELLAHGIVEIVCVAPRGDYNDAVLWIGNLRDPEGNNSSRLKNTLLEWHETPPQITALRDILD